MNPFNLLINYFIANSRASYYNVPGNPDVTNTGILAGMISENPLLSYLIIDNKAKAEGESFHSAATEPVIVPVVHSAPALPPTGTVTPPIVPETQTTSAVTLEEVKAEITANNERLTGTILEKLSGLLAKIESFDKDQIANIEKRLGEVERANKTGNSKPAEPDVKTQSKTNPK